VPQLGQKLGRGVEQIGGAEVTPEEGVAGKGRARLLELRRFGETIRGVGG
jgi:hypothetical protein